MALSETARGHVALAFFSLFVAGTYSLGSLAAPYIDAALLMAMRFSIAAALMGAIVAARYPAQLRQISTSWRYLVLGTVFAIYFVALFEALKTTSAVSTGAMFTLTPFLTAGFAYLLLQQRLSSYVLLCLSIAAAGAIWVIFRGDPNSLLSFDLGRGEKIFLIGVVAHALYVPLARKLDRGEPVAVLTLGVLAGGSIPLLAISFTRIFTTDWSAIPAIVWVALGYMVVFATLITFVLMLYANQRLPGAKVMAYTYLIPTWVVIWESILGQELENTRILFGIGLTIVAMLMLLRAK